jgi:hypothetical protein
MKYYIIATKNNIHEVIDETEDKANAEYLRTQYQISYGSDWKIEIIEDNRGE